MPGADARIPTDRAQRYLEQLCGHLGAMGHMRHMPARGHGGGGMPTVVGVERSADHAVIRFTDGSWEMEASGDALTLHVEADTAASLDTLAEAITARVTKIGRRDGLTVTWSSSVEPRDSRGAVSSPGTPAARPGAGWWRRLR
jgi:hypothetical protein